MMYGISGPQQVPFRKAGWKEFDGTCVCCIIVHRATHFLETVPLQPHKRLHRGFASIPRHLLPLPRRPDQPVKRIPCANRAAVGPEREARAPRPQLRSPSPGLPLPTPTQSRPHLRRPHSVMAQRRGTRLQPQSQHLWVGLRSPDLPLPVGCGVLPPPRGGHRATQRWPPGRPICGHCLRAAGPLGRGGRGAGDGTPAGGGVGREGHGGAPGHAARGPQRSGVHV